MAIFGGFLFFAKNQDFAVSDSAQITTMQNIEPKVVNSFSHLTPEQKISQLLAVSLTLTNTPISSTAANKQIQEITQLQPGIIVLYGKKLNFDIVKTTTEKIAAVTIPIPISIAVDHEGGTVQRLSGKGFTPVDAWGVLCESDQATRTKIFETTAQELQAAGVTLALGPTIDSATTSSKALKTRLCKTDSATLTQNTQEVIEIYLRAGITPTLKHYPGIGSLTVDLHDAYAQIADTTKEQPMFHHLLNQNPTIAVMTAHAGLPGSNIPCSLSEECIQPLQQHPEALIITDDIDMKATLKETAHPKSQQLAELTHQAIQAGNTIVLLGPNIQFVEIQKIIAELSSRYETDSSFASQVDKNLVKIINWKHE